MELYDITKVDIFSLQNLKRGELSAMHSLLLLLYSKYHGNDEVSLKYSEVSWMNYNFVGKILTKLQEKELISIVKKPTKISPYVIKLKPNNELHYILNKNKKIEFHKYSPFYFTRSHFTEAIDCGTLSEHFVSTTIPSWLRNINNQKWDLYKFLTITKIISYFSCDYNIKTFTTNKYVSKKASLNSTIKFLYEKVPDNRKEILYSQFENTLNDLKIKHDKSFVGIVNSYLKYIKSK